MSSHEGRIFIRSHKMCSRAMRISDIFRRPIAVPSRLMSSSLHYGVSLSFFLSLSSVSLAVCLTFLYACQYVSLFNLCLCTTSFFSLFLCLSLCPSLLLFFSPSHSLSFSLHSLCFSLFLSLYVSHFFSFSLSVFLSSQSCLSFSLRVSLFLSLSLSLSLSVSVSLCFSLQPSSFYLSLHSVRMSLYFLSSCS